MTITRNARWIWLPTEHDAEHQFVCFRKSFELDKAENGTLLIAADTDFVAYVNGVEIGRRQFSDWPQNKTYSEFPVSGILRKGGNTIAVHGYYCGGEGFLAYTAGKAGMIAALDTGSGEIVTDKSWKCLRHPAFQSGGLEKLTSQLGFVVKFDAQLDIDWINPDYDDSHWSCAGERGAATGDYWLTLAPRPVPPLLIGKQAASRLVIHGMIRREREAETFAKSAANDAMIPMPPEKIFSKAALQPEPVAMPAMFNPLEGPANGYFAIADLGAEMSGLLELDVSAPAGTILDISHGEHLNDGRVRMSIQSRNFTDRYICKSGRNHFTMPFRRIAGRYIQLNITNISGSVTVNYLGLRPTTLQLPPGNRFVSNSPLANLVYETGVRTLELCMHEHYEDCPWREQSLYAYDSRNQALFGYYVWGNYDFAAASFELLGNGIRPDGMLQLCAPAKLEMTIPMFSFAWIAALNDLRLHSGRNNLTDKFEGQIEFMLQKVLAAWDPSSGLYGLNRAEYCWHFYEWCHDMNQHGSADGEFHAAYNLYLCETLRAYSEMLAHAGKTAEARLYLNKANKLAVAVERWFWNPADNCYATKMIGGKLSGRNATIQFLALSLNLVPAEKIAAALDSVFSGKLVPATLSSMPYMVRSMMRLNPETRKYVSEKIASHFESMILAGATSMWETDLGAEDFAGAGSLCHGWSSLPVYYYHAYVLGIRPLEPGFRKFSISPYPGSFFTAEGTVATPSGIIRAGWKLNNGKLEFTAEGPKGLTPTLIPLPEAPIASAFYNGKAI